LVQLNFVLVHELSLGERRLFLLVRDVVSQAKLDPVLDIPQLRMSPQWRIIGLSAATAERVYIIARTQTLRAFKIEGLRFTTKDFEGVDMAVDEEGNLLHCPWEITFM
jgi:hypothetical protein